MADSYVDYTGDNNIVSFGLAFSGGAALDDSHIKVYLDAALQSTGFSIVGSNVVFDAAPGSGVIVSLHRETPRKASERMVDFEDASYWRADDVDLAHNQTLYAAQEARDVVDSIQEQVIAGGDLPPVSAANVGDFLVVVVDAWAIQTTAQAQTQLEVNASLYGLTVGTAADNLMQLDANAKIPAVDGSQLTNVTDAPGFGTAATRDTGESRNNIPILGSNGSLSSDVQIKNRVATFRYKEATGDDGPAVYADTDNAVPLNDTLVNYIDGASIDTGSHTITLPAGYYLILAAAAPFSVTKAQLSVYNMDTSAHILLGLAGASSASYTASSLSLCGALLLSGETDLKLVLYSATAGFHGEHSDSGEDEVYATITIIKLG